ncbi:hypothetical protein CRG98_047331, partial [Punica granatum]
MDTLAVAPPKLPSTPRLPLKSFSVNFSGRSFSPFALLNSRSNFPTLKCSHARTVTCSAQPTPSLVEQSVKFQEAAKEGNLVPLFRCIFSDHLTPVLAYRCLVKEDDRDAPSFLFESVEPGLQASSV